MSEIADAAKVSLFVGDVGYVDAGKKLNVMGANWQISGMQPTGMSAPCCVVCLIDIPADFIGQHCSVELALLDEHGVPVEVPLPPGGVIPSGQTSALRVAQLVNIEAPAIPNMILPPGLPSKIQMVLTFPNGLPLGPGRMYKWRLQIDGNTRPEWENPFYVAAPPPAPVIG